LLAQSGTHLLHRGSLHLAGAETLPYLGRFFLFAFTGRGRGRIMSSISWRVRVVGTIHFLSALTIFRPCQHLGIEQAEFHTPVFARVVCQKRRVQVI
jgi:hypothetical protein